MNGGHTMRTSEPDGAALTDAMCGPRHRLSMVVRMSLNVERARELLEGLRDEDPHADARRSLIGTQAGQPPTRSRAVVLLSAELIRDPVDLMVSTPPSWLIDLARLGQPGARLLFDSRLSDLAARSVDDLVAGGVPVDALVVWLEDRRRRARADSPS
jgi:hypothetical protein